MNKSIADQGYYVPSLLDPEGVIAQAYGVEAFPSEVFIDADGVIRRTQIGGMSSEDMWAAVTAIAPRETTTTTAKPTTTTAAAPTSTAGTTSSTVPGADTEDGKLSGAMIAVIACVAVIVVALIGFIAARLGRRRRSH